MRPNGSGLEQLTNDPAYDDGKWIAFSSSRNHSAPFAHGRWERLQFADIYIIHPDRSGLKKITKGSGFCGSPKWMPDGHHVVAYCMTAEQTLANRIAHPDPGNDTKLVSIECSIRPERRSSWGTTLTSRSASEVAP